jgi:hypothetical protein
MILYGFPLYLLAVEYLLRAGLSQIQGGQQDISLVAASNTIATAGLSFIAPVVIEKPYRKEFLEEALKAIGQNGTVTVTRDQKLVRMAYVALGILPFAWAFTLWIAHKGTKDFDWKIWDYAVPGPLWMSLGLYIVGIVFTEPKEKS